MRSVSRASATMFSEGDLGVLPPLGVFDPLGLIETRDMRRYEIMEIKHGRAAMLGFLHVIAIEAGIRVPGYLSTSQNLKFSAVPAPRPRPSSKRVPFLGNAAWWRPLADCP